MLLIDIYRYLKRRADNRPVYLKNFVDQSHHHGTRPEEPSVSIIIPTRDKVELLRACVESVIEKTIYKNYEIVVVDNQSADPQTLQYFGDLKGRGVRIIKYPRKFNYSAICNLAAANSTAEYLCFLNNDTEVIEPGWLGSLVDHASQSEVGVVGSLLLSDKTIQHGGIAMGHTGIAGHVGLGATWLEFGASNCISISAATFACALVARKHYLEVGGLNEDFRVGLNDVDFCLKTESLGLVNVLCERSVLIHKEGKTRPKPTSFRGIWSALSEIALFTRIWPAQVFSDKYFESSDE